MKGTDKTGIRVAKGGSRGACEKFHPSLEDLTGLGPEVERDGAIVALHFRCDWSPKRLGTLFGLTDKRIYQILAGFQKQYPEAIR